MCNVDWCCRNHLDRHFRFACDCNSSCRQVSTEMALVRACFTVRRDPANWPGLWIDSFTFVCNCVCLPFHNVVSKSETCGLSMNPLVLGYRTQSLKPQVSWFFENNFFAAAR